MIIRNPQNPILTIKAPTLWVVLCIGFKGFRGFRGLGVRFSGLGVRV